ncbi:uncharacterized protein LOC121580031 isoform X1 [Coregonus clupeaformis]|uniref:uncharacterized protein LOC121580031 isoform X1 n=1 Tax=Coregonus clupeaformis TaxID=59861 RepID=UPI001E1C6B34|nr:uncharacterized protein LOC121580031 isoform X1 [Coregonus clupeaformis]
MERIRRENYKDPLLSISYLRLLAPPLQLLSAAMWQVVQKGLVMHYGMLEEFVTSVTEMVPELLTYRQRAQLILGLRARLVLELCRGDHQVDPETIQPHLDRIKASITTPRDHCGTDAQVEDSGANFLELVQTLLQDPGVKEHFFLEVFPVQYGQKYDTALEILLWEFLSRLEELLPVPDFAQMVSWLDGAPSVLDECLQSATPPEEMKALIEHHRNLGHIYVKDTRSLPMDDCILSSLSLPPVTKPVTTADKHTQKHSDHPNKEEIIEVPIDQSNLETGKRRISERTKQKRNEQRDRIEKDEIMEEGTPFSANESRRGQTLPWKRKMSDNSEVPGKRQADSPLFQDSPVNIESSSESPLISIWGEYTEPQGAAYSMTTDTKVPWSDDETLNLIEIWGKDSVQRVLKGCVKNRHVFTLISKSMSERGYMRTVEQCQTRIKRLKNSFRQSLQQKVECKFYDQLERILGNVSSSTFPEVTYDVEEVTDDQLEDTEDWEFPGHSGLEEIGTRSVPWTDLETLTLINIWGEDKMQRELRGMHRNGHLFAVISQKMSAQGFIRTAEQCQTRVKRLKRSFRQCYENNMKGREQVECKFYDLLERILGNELPSYVEVSENCLDMESREGWSADNECSVYSFQEREAAVGVPEDRKKVPWADGETVILLELWGDDTVQQNLKRCPHNGHIYSEISEKLNFRGFYRTAEQCHTRIKRLKASYRQCQETISSSGSEQVDFKFYDILELILERQPPSTSTVVTDLTNDISEESNSDSLQESTEADNNITSERTTPGSWSDPETLALIDIWGEDEVQRVLRDFVHNGPVYMDISEKMHDQGYSKTPEQCRWKVKSMRNNFRQCYDRKKCGRKGVEYKFYNQLERILGHEAVSIDEYDERDDQSVDQYTGADEMRYTPWSEPETLALIELWGNEEVQTSLRGCVRNGHIFADIAEKLATMGHFKTAEQCHSRVKRLRKTYRRCLHSRKVGGEPLLFRYFRFLEPVLGNDTLSPDAEIVDLCDDFNPDPTEEADQETCQGSASYAVTESSRKMPWSDWETQALLGVWGEDHVQLSLRGCLKNRHVFEYISRRMMAQGFIRTAEQCHTRIKRLKASFHHDKRECKFYDQMEEILSRELNFDSLAEDSLDNEEAAVCESTLEVDQRKASRPPTDGSKFPWSDSETQVLLSFWGSDEVQEDLKGCTKNRHIFTEISQAMANQGYLRTAEQCQSRVKRLKANFRQFCESKQSGGENVECKFYDQFVQIFRNKHLSCDSLAEESNGATDMGEVPGSQVHGTESGSYPSPWELDHPWSIEETEALLDIWGSDRIQEDLRGNTELEHIYAEISQMMADQGFMKTAEQCQTRATQLNLSIIPI